MSAIRRPILTTTLALAFALAAGCSPPEEAPSADLFAEGAAQSPSDATVVRARRLEPRFDVTKAAAGEVLHLNLFDDAAFDAKNTGLRASASGSVWMGELTDQPGEVSLAVVDGVYAGTVRAGDKLFQIGHDAQGHFVVERDEAAIDEHPPLTPNVVADALPASLPPEAADADTQIDVMVVYTADVLASAGSAAAMAAVIDLAVDETNQGYVASGVGIHMRLVHTALTSYDESGFDWSETLSRLAAPSDGFMDEIHALRDEHGADHVVLLVETVGPYAGIGYQMQALTAPYFADYAFAVVAHSYATGAYTFGHELGHNMGATHDHNNATSGFYPYSFGHQAPEAGFRTVMAYACAGCVRVNRWSNPRVGYNGAPTGIIDYADNARSLNATKTIAAAFREPPLGPPTDVAKMIEPADESTLEGATVTFSWEDAGALSYRLDVGSAVGDDSYHTDGYAGTSATVADLPRDGSAVFVRLWSESSSAGWVFNDYRYTAWVQPTVVASVLTSPAPGTALPGSDVTFTWDISPGADDYRLAIGASGDPSRYFDGTLGLTGSQRVVGLPTDGAGLLATLYTHGPSGWQSTTANYRAFAPVVGGPLGPVLLAPVAGTPLTGITQRFVWQALGAIQYWLMIERSDGSVVFSASTGTATEKTVTGLPSSGGLVSITVFAQLPTGWVQRTTVLQAPSDL